MMDDSRQQSKHDFANASKPFPIAFEGASQIKMILWPLVHRVHRSQLGRREPRQTMKAIKAITSYYISCGRHDAKTHTAVFALQYRFQLMRRSHEHSIVLQIQWLDQWVFADPNLTFWSEVRTCLAMLQFRRFKARKRQASLGNAKQHCLIEHAKFERAILRILRRWF